MENLNVQGNDSNSSLQANISVSLVGTNVQQQQNLGHMNKTFWNKITEKWGSLNELQKKEIKCLCVIGVIVVAIIVAFAIYCAKKDHNSDGQSESSEGTYDGFMKKIISDLKNMYKKR